MKSTKLFAVTVVICNFLCAPLAFADTIIFKTGKELEVGRTWQEGERICFFFHGIEASIPQRKIVRIKSDSEKRNKTFASSRTTKPDLRKANAGQNQNPAHRDSCSAVKCANALRKDGFCDLKWGRKLVTVLDFKEKGTNSGLDNVVEYVRSNDIMAIEDIPLKSITYAFWKGRLYTVTVWTNGFPNYAALRDKVFEEFGPGKRTETDNERYLWSDTLSDIMLEYIEDDQYGMLWLRSKEVEELSKSSRLRGHASYLKWMNSRN